jgi:hypothetical protein
MFVVYGYNAELWQFSQQLYPDLPPIEAYLALHHDYVTPMVGPVINGALTAAEAWALWKDPTSIPLIFDQQNMDRRLLAARKILRHKLVDVYHALDQFGPTLLPVDLK